MVTLFSAFECLSYHPPLLPTPKKKVHTIPTVSHSPPTALKQGQKHMNQSVSCFFLHCPPSSVWVKLPQGTFPDHHKQAFSFFALISNYKVMQWPHTRSLISKRFWFFGSAEHWHFFLKWPRSTPPDQIKLIFLSFTTWLSSTNQHSIAIQECNRKNHEELQLTDIFPFTSHCPRNCTCFLHNYLYSSFLLS